MQVTMIRMRNTAGTYSWFWPNNPAKGDPVPGWWDVEIEEFDPDIHQYLAASLAANPLWEWNLTTTDPHNPPRVWRGRNHSDPRGTFKKF